MRYFMRRRLALYVIVFLGTTVVVVESFWNKKKTKEKNKKSVPLEMENASGEPYTECNIFLAPSSNFGWGVFAARDFRAAELVEIAPAYLPLESQGVEVQSSILFDYVHASACQPDEDEQEEITEKDQLLLGHGSSYNHNEDPNIQFVEYGRGRGHVMGVQALRNISMGEELLARYGDNDWFTSRSIPQKHGTSTPIPPIDVPGFKSQYCSKIHAGVGSQTWTHKVLPNVTVINFWFDANQRLPPRDAGFGVARAKIALQAGDRIELSLGLLVSQRIMADSIVAPLLFSWADLTSDQQRVLRMLRKNFRDQFIVHYPGREERHNVFDSYEDLAILPIGALAMVRRLGRGESSNCRLNIRETMQPGSSSLALELVATEDIAQDQVLLLDLPPAGTPSENDLLEAELKRTGQPYHASTFASAKIRDEL